MSDVVTVDPLEAGREAYARRAWPEAYRLLLEADGQGALEPEDLEALAKSAWWIGLATESIAAFERAYALHLERGNRSMAAMMALTLRREYGAKMAGSVAKAWLHRAEHLLEGEPEAVAHGYLEIAHRELDFDRGNIEGALAHLDRAKEIASRLDDADLPVWVAMSRAEVLGTSGQLDEAFGLMEGAAAVAVGGELGPFTTGAVFCDVMSVCRETADYRRGSEWADVSKRWCERQDISGFPGICRVHRAEFMRLTGAWADAASEAERASEELQRFHPAAAGGAFHELGEVRLRMGDLEGAEEAFGQARALGDGAATGQGAPAPGAGAHGRRGGLDQGRVSRRSRGTSSRGLGCSPRRRRSRRRWATSPRRRPPRRSSRVIAEEFGTAAIRAAAAHASGLVALLREDAAEADQAVPRRAAALARDRRPVRSGDLHGAARGGAIGRGGDRSGDARARGGPGHVRAARRDARHGADGCSVGRAGDSLGRRGRSARSCSPTSWDPPRWSRRSGTRPGTTSCAGTTTRFADASRQRCGRGGPSHGRRLLRGVPGRAARRSRAPAMIQRTLADHRRAHGFAPQVRIGVHAAEATRAAGDYEGAGVHAAARIGALARGWRGARERRDHRGHRE